MAVTAYSAQGDEERIRAAGAQAYVSKPISVVRFAQTVDELLEAGGDDAATAAEVKGGSRIGVRNEWIPACARMGRLRGYAARLT